MTKPIAIILMLICALVLTLPAQAASWRAQTRQTLKQYAYACKTATVDIEQIVTNDHISGTVRGLPVEAHEKFKVVFYVKTNRWYVHPYYLPGDQQDGISYSSIAADGSFRVKTVRRDVASKQLAAVVVPTSYIAKSQRFWLRPFLNIFGGVLKYSCTSRIIAGNGDF